MFPDLPAYVASVKRLLVGVSSTPCWEGTAIHSSSSRPVAT
jgi:hypothetical protein